MRLQLAFFPVLEDSHIFECRLHSKDIAISILCGVQRGPGRLAGRLQGLYLFLCFPGVLTGFVLVPAGFVLRLSKMESIICISTERERDRERTIN